MGSRMRIEVYLADVEAVEVRVELRGRDAGVTEQFLHDSKVRATLQKGEPVDPRIMRPSTSEVLATAMSGK